MKENKSIGKLILVILCIIAIVFSVIIILKNNNNEEQVVDTSIPKKELSLKDDYYEYINKDIIDNIELESDEGKWQLFMNTQDTIDDKVSEIVKEMVDKNENENITKLYNSVINRKEDLSILDAYIEDIDNSNNLNELLDNIAKISEELCLGMLIPATISKDLENNEEPLIYIYPFTYDFGSYYPDYYTNILYMSYAKMFEEYNEKIFMLYGYTEDDAKESVSKISKFYTEIAKNSKTIEELSDTKSLYNIQTDAELNEIYTNLDIDKFLSGYNETLRVSVVDIEQAKAINEYLKEENLDTLKEYAKLQILQNYAAYGSMDNYNLMLELNAAMLGTEVSKDTAEDLAIDMVSAYFNTEISKKYLSENVSEDKVLYFKEMVNDIIEQYKVIIANKDWLSEDTKQKALLKLDNITVNVGYPDKFRPYSEKYILGDSFLENMINMNKIYSDCGIESIINGEDYWAMSILTVNAYYNYQDNSINFPAAILEYELYSEDNSYYENLGSLGMIIAHEITHAFDNNGALFDEKGNMNNWWTDEDYSNFEVLQEKVIEYYDEYKMNGKSVDGKLTVSENIADLGAVSCIVEIAKQKGATNDELKELFEAYANIWASKATKEYIKLAMMTDTHSPDKIRVNAVLSSIDEFYEAYDITEGDGMYKSPEERVKVW